MRLTTFLDRKGTPCFGMAIGDYLYSFKDLQQVQTVEAKRLTSLEDYLENVDEGFSQALFLYNWLSSQVDVHNLSAGLISQTKLLPAITHPVALIDFGLSPRHLINSGRTLIKHEFSWPISKIVESIALRRFKKNKADEFPYYKGNHHEISGQYDTIPWPEYASYLDIEPELAFVMGNDINGKPVISGYCILNDASARDVQLPEMMSIGPGRCKDFTAGNGLSSFLVTPDEIDNVLNLSVSVDIGGRLHWTGTTAEYSAQPSDIVRYLSSVFTLRPGTIIGMGTIPGCCCLDNDIWLRPGEDIIIGLEGIGRLEQKYGIPAKLQPSRWGQRDDL